MKTMRSSSQSIYVDGLVHGKIWHGKQLLPVAIASGEANGIL